MAALRYRPDWSEAQARLTAWWHGEDLGRAMLLLTAPRTEPWEEIPALQQPDGWESRYSTKSLAYSVNHALRSCLHNLYLGEAVPYYPSGDPAAGAVAMYLGCTGIEAPGTVWHEPCIESPETARFEYDPDNPAWRWTNDVLDQVLPAAQGKFYQQFPDLIEGLDVLAAMRGTSPMLMDLLDRPEWVHQSLARITDLYFRYYDLLYDRIRDEVGGCVFWCWAPGRLAKLQCDCCAMLSPNQFREFMVPVFLQMTERLSYSFYHLDGIEATRHLDALLSLPRLQMVQWTPGAGQPGMADESWFPMYHRIIDAGKKVFLPWIPIEGLPGIRQEFGRDSRQFMIGCRAADAQHAAECLRLMEC